MALTLISLCIAPVHARQEYNSRIPNGAVFSCDNCHTTGNQFKDDFSNAGKTWTQNLAAMDSDGDGYTNGEELQDPDGNWNPGNPDPGNPADVTNPGDPASHPGASTPTPPPTATPEDTPSPEPTASATPTPEGCTETGVSIEMPQSTFQTGDVFYCRVLVCNAEGHTLSGYPLFVILEYQGFYFFAPDFSDFNYYQSDFSTGETRIEVIPEFSWPEINGSDGAVFYSALTNPAITELFGKMSSFQFTWE